MASVASVTQEEDGAGGEAMKRKKLKREAEAISVARYLWLLCRQRTMAISVAVGRGLSCFCDCQWSHLLEAFKGKICLEEEVQWKKEGKSGAWNFEGKIML
ncbi:hypothetical protein L1887_30401 [Cichorium endivia]|nr:hypothetical protein L1887_30401 [Cichorium endivia]